METKHEVIPIFPTPLYINEVPEQLVKDHLSLLDNEKILGRRKNTGNDEYGWRSKNTYILNQPQYKNLNKYIIQQSNIYAENYMNYGYGYYKITQSWISVKLPEEEHIAHFHPNSLISGILFYGDFTDKTSYVTFYRNDEYSKTLTAHKKNNNLSYFNTLESNINFKPNLLILFPSYLVHSVSKNITNIPRKSLAFNIIPRDGFGIESELNELKFNT